MAIRKRWLLGISLMFLVFTQGHAQLREYVAIVRPHYHENTRRNFSAWAKYFADRGDDYWSRFFRWHAGELGETSHGTGWVFVADDGGNFLITNRHVVEQAATANIIFELENGSRTVFENCLVVYSDDYLDLAILRFPDGSRPFSRGLEILNDRQPDGTEIVAAGFPGFGAQPLWQYSSGIVSNSAARIDPSYDYLIQHTAPIDPGNSGGPLMVRDARTAAGFRVVGINTSKAVGRENTNFAIPAMYVLEVIEKARESLAIENDEESLEAELVRNAQILAAELSSDQTDQQRMSRFVSYAYVGDVGLEAYAEILPQVEHPEIWTENFRNDPVGSMRIAVQASFQLELQAARNGRAIEFSKIIDVDKNKISSKETIRTLYTFGDDSAEISWIREHGHWRIRGVHTDSHKNNAVSSPVVSKTTTSEEPAKLWLFGIRAGIGSSSSHGALYDDPVFQSQWNQTSWYFGLSVERLIAPALWLESGLNLVRMAHGFYIASSTPYQDADVVETVTYLQIPVIFKIGFGWSHGGIFFGLGPALDLAVAAGGDVDDYTTGQSGSLDDSYYDDYLNRVNISLLGSIAFEYWLNESSAIALEMLIDYHLLNDFDWDVSEPTHFLSIGGGLHYKHRF